MMSWRYNTLWTGMALSCWLSSQALAQELPAVPPAPTMLPSAEVPASAPALPAMGAQAAEGLPPVPENNAAPQPAQIAPAEVPATDPSIAGVGARQFSYGDPDAKSLLYTPSQINGLKRSVEAFENIRPGQGNGELTVIEEAPVIAPKIEEPATYPSYFLSSIAYRTPKDWTVWVNNTRITPKTNDGELKVVSVSPNRVSFTWSPSYIKAIVARIDNKNIAPIDAVIHRTVKPNSARIDRDNGVITFSLQQNQSFAAGYFWVFEGAMPSPAMPQAETATPTLPPGMSAEDAAAINGLLGAPMPGAPAGVMNGATPEANDRSAMEGLISNQKQITPKEVPLQ